MAGQQGALLERDLRLELRALLQQATNEIVVDDFRRLEDPSQPQRLADELGAGLKIGLLRARLRKLRVEFSKLLRGNRGVVRAHEEALRGPEGLDLALGGDHLLHQRLDGLVEPVRSDPAGLVLGALFAGQVFLGDAVRDIRRDLGVLGLELDRDHAALAERVDQQALEIHLKHTLFLRHRPRVFRQAERDQHRAGKPDAFLHGIVFRALG